jgi:ParB family chromosome partitioning protein
MGDYYQIIAGERRWRACRLAELREVPVVIIEADDKKVMELAMVENLQRQDLNPMEEAEGYYSLIHDFKLSQEQVAERVGKSRPAVANALRLLSLKGELREMVEDGKISAGHARALLTLPTEKLQKSAAQKVIALELSVRQTESMCKKMLTDLAAEEEKPAPLTVDYVGECEKLLTKQLGRKVKIINGKRKGKFELEFYGQDDLQVLYETLLSLRAPEKN